MYISIIITISRPDNISFVLQQLEKLVKEDFIFELIIAVDNRKIATFHIERLIEQLNFPFRNVTVFNTKRASPSKIDIPTRRTRIAQTMNDIRERIGGSNYVFGFEDDTELSPGCVSKLVWAMSSHGELVGYVEGVQVGRWGYPYIGAFLVDDIENPTEYNSLPYSEGVHGIDGGGFYCFLTPTALFKAHEHKWDEPVGPDVYYGLTLRRKGYINLINWSVTTGHKSKNKMLYPTSKTAKVKLQLEGNRWLTHVTI